MRKLLSAVVVLAGAALLSSCALVPPGAVYDDSHAVANARVEQITAAVNSHDAAALKVIFSARALEKATGIDDEVGYLLSAFPNGGLTWELNGVDSRGRSSNGKSTEVLWCSYTVTANGESCWLFFADFTVNDLVDPKNVGIYALGVAPRTESADSDEEKAYFAWVNTFDLDGNGIPGVYVPIS